MSGEDKNCVNNSENVPSSEDRKEPLMIFSSNYLAELEAAMEEITLDDVEDEELENVPPKIEGYEKKNYFDELALKSEVINQPQPEDSMDLWFKNKLSNGSDDSENDESSFVKVTAKDLFENIEEPTKEVAIVPDEICGATEPLNFVPDHFAEKTSNEPEDDGQKCFDDFVTVNLPKDSQTSENAFQINQHNFENAPYVLIVRKIDKNWKDEEEE